MRIYFPNATNFGSYQFISLFFEGFVFIVVSKIGDEYSSSLQCFRSWKYSKVAACGSEQTILGGLFSLLGPNLTFMKEAKARQ